ncbi:DUF5691 domain-containing protein [Comamonas sp. B21-038]|uniref:DUF5691 domain-containing protein n=1 Tax=Comamonas sp. B21-038 TaxID=2918299 RepID=UPI001EFB4C9E|nr:DUF5691 domain-containing protein [Comamonas sp. B21-038]ULR87254.1 DUF5691 domain-containing protein [Comamonas sp. B21-038]
MSHANLWAALQQSALVGAERLALPAIFTQGIDRTAPASQQALQAALLQPADSKAQQLLRATAVAAVLERAGWRPAQPAATVVAAALPPPAAESRPAPQGEPLLRLLGEVLQGNAPELLALALVSLDEAGQRLPYALLVDALHQGRQSVELRQWLTPVLGERGRWLAAQNPQWAYAHGVQETADAEQIWQEGSLEQRVALLLQQRATDPAGARARLEASLKELGARERAPMVQSLARGLSADDEALLEKLLCNRSKEVRESAASLLARLPHSPHSQRMGAALQAMLSQDAQGEWQIEPPQEGHKDWERDGVTLQPPAYIKGHRAWWLQQLVELTPLDFWHQQLNKTPEQLWEWSRRSDWKSALRQGWIAALRAQRDVRWLPLIQSMESDSRSSDVLPLLMAELSAEERETQWLAQLQAKLGKSAFIEAIHRIDEGMGRTELLSPAMSRWLLEALLGTLQSRQPAGNWHSWQADHAILACARRLQVGDLERFAQLWRAPPAAAPAEPVASDDASALVVPEGSSEADIAKLQQEQQARLERSRLRPWDDEQVLAQLNRIVDLRLALQAARIA